MNGNDDGFEREERSPWPISIKCLLVAAAAMGLCRLCQEQEGRLAEVADGPVAVIADVTWPSAGKDTP